MSRKTGNLCSDFKKKIALIRQGIFNLSIKNRLSIYLIGLVISLLLMAGQLFFFKMNQVYILALVPIVISGWLFSYGIIFLTTFLFSIIYVASLFLFHQELSFLENLPNLFFYLFHLLAGITVHKVFALYKELDYELKQKKNNEHLQELAKNWFRIALFSIGDGIIAVNEQNIITFLNYEAEKLTGWTSHEAIGRNIAEVYRIANEQTRKEILNPVQRILDRGFTIGLANHTLLIDKSGREIPIGDSGTLIKAKTGQIQGFIIIFRDVSSKKKMEKELKNAQAQAIHSEKLASIGQLAAGVAHEINNPLGYINSNLETLFTYLINLKKIIHIYKDTTNKEKIGKAEEELRIGYILEDIDSLLADNKKGINKIIGIVKNLKDFARLNTQEELEITNLESIITNVLSVIGNKIKYAAVVHTELKDNLLVNCNRTEINQVVLNLLLNSIHAIESKFQGQPGKITIITGKENGYVFCRIQDNGCGIPNEILARIFEPFFTTKAPGDGTGLGLYIVYDIIVQKHKGEVLVRSDEGEGTVFTVKLPVKP